MYVRLPMRTYGLAQTLSNRATPRKASVRRVVLERFRFNVSIPDGKRWQPITKALFDLDKTLFPELMGE